MRARERMGVLSLRGTVSVCRRHRGDSGFTMVEVVMTLTIIVIIVLSLAMVFWELLGGAATTSDRTDAAALATRELETVHGISSSQVGFYGDEPGYVTSFEGYATVTLGPTTPSGTIPQVEPETPDPSASTTFPPDPNPANANPIVVHSVSFSVQRYLVWVNAQAINASSTATTYSQAYKRLSVIVSWSDLSGSHLVRQDTLIYPGSQGPYQGPGGATTTTTTTTTTSTAPSTPILTATTASGSAGQSEIILSWTQPSGGGAVSNYTINYSVSSSFPSGSTTTVGPLSSGTTSWPITGLNASTTYFFRLNANGSGGSSTSATVSATTASAPCTLGTLTVQGATSGSTTGTILKQNGQVSENLNLTLNTSGPCTDTYSVQATNSNGSADPGSPYSLSAGSGGTYTGTAYSKNQTGWSTGTHTFTVLDNGNPTTDTASFVVCAYGSTSCP